MVAVGELHTCALLNTGGVKCWGNNDDGQIGNNAQSSTAVLAPTDVVNATSGIVAISAGAYHTCALTTGGGVKCWGDNVTGGVGNDTSSNDVLTAQNVYGLTSGVKQITTGLGHSCALTTSGGVKCWGNNYFGQLGDGNTDTESDRPVNVVGLSSGVAAITAGYSFTCALLTTGAVKCWGDNYYRSLGAGSTENEVTDVLQVTGLTSGVAKLEAGQDHACVVLTGGTVKCWGRNSDGQTGIGSSSTSVDAPPTSGILSSIANVNPGGFFSCALSTVGDVMCWGNNQYGQMGNNTSGSTDVLTPVNVNTFDFD
jgi:alpha-tubulin suppressor-like RCC1 family protein